jgi:hypothetical protein
MLLEGATYAVSGGFEIAIRHQTMTETINLELDDPRRPALNSRQRFTLAHEIGHTLYYDSGGRRPVLIDGVPRGDALEAYCNRAAGMFLVPGEHLYADLAHRAVSLDCLRWLTRRYQASSAAVILRIDELMIARPNDRGLIYVETRDGDVRIVAAYIPPSLQIVLPRPKPSVTSFKTWGRSFVTRDFLDSPSWRRDVDIYGLRVAVEKRSDESDDAFYVEIAPLDKSHDV